ncbi:MAG: SAF domain-containing protein [Propionibacteriaceae bacterium]|jgi:Flp pilus assembly protein CpaB|nr:SAF domain-containing protein [Propionibacteriaceae bacterium]
MNIFKTLKRAVARWRRLLAAALAMLAVLTGLSAVQAQAQTAPAVVASGEIAPGQVLTAADVQLVQFPAEHLPAHALASVAEAVGQTAQYPIDAGAVVTDTAFGTEDGLVADGLVALPVSFASSATAGLLQVGDHIDILGQLADVPGQQVLAEAVRVVAVPEESGRLISSSSGGLLVEVTPEQAALITNSALLGGLSFAIR